MHPLLVIACFFSLGFIVSRLWQLPASLPMRLNQFVIHLVLPAIILLRIPGLDLGQDIWFPVLSCWLVTGISAGCVWWLGRRLGWPRAVTGALMMVVPLGNTSYLGFPVIRTLLGDAAMPFAILYDQIGTFLALAVYGTVIIATYGQGTNQVSLKRIGLQIFKFPPFLTLLLALNLDALPAALIQPLHWVSLSLAPLTMFIIGLQFRPFLDRELRLPLILGLGLKMGLTPALLLSFGLFLGIPDLPLHTLTLEAGMPSMVTAGVMAMAAGLAPRLCAGMVGFGLVAAAFTLGGWHLLLDFMLPLR